MNEDGETLQILNVVLTKLTKEYNSNPEKTGIKLNKDGSFNVEIDKGPTYWFKDEMELGSWVLGMYHDN